MDISAADLITIGLLVVLEGLLSADNALVMAIMVLGLPRRDHQKALRYGLLGGFASRALATMLAVYLIRVGWFRLLTHHPRQPDPPIPRNIWFDFCEVEHQA